MLRRIRAPQPARLALLLLLPVAWGLAPCVGLAECGFGDPVISPWVLNTDGRRGQSGVPAIHAVVSTILADVQQVRFTPTDVYVNATGIPSYLVGPFPDGNPNIPYDQSWLFRIPRDPQPAAVGMHQATGLGAIGTWVNGVVMFNAKDARSWQNQGIWNQNAVVVEGPGFDAALGHPAMNRMQPPPNGVYHHHQRPVSLLAQLGDDGVSHSPLVGFGFDGFPVYGPYGFANPDGSGGVRRIDSSYRLRSITQRHDLPDGTPLAMAQWGPDVSAAEPLGTYIEDFEYVNGLGDLDQFNGRFGVTPEYPLGTYAYFTTQDAAGNSAYPYGVGPRYYGVPQADNISRSVVVPVPACVFSEACVEGDCPGSCSDGIDDEGDGLTDCEDPDCDSAPECATGDSDGDGVNDGSDCAPLDGSAFAIPAEVTGLRMAKGSLADEVVLTWQDAGAVAGTGTVYDVASDVISTLRATRIVDAPCVAQAVIPTSFTDSVTVTNDCIYWLVGAFNACGPPPGLAWGAGSDGTPRLACP